MHEICDGIENADSWSVDAHKTLNVPYDSGMILCRHREALMNAVKASASYFQWSEHRDGMNFRPSMSSRRRAIRLSGRSQDSRPRGSSATCRAALRRCAEFARLLAEQDFQIHNDVVFDVGSRVMRRRRPNESNAEQGSSLRANAGAAAHSGTTKPLFGSAFAIGPLHRRKSSGLCALLLPRAEPQLQNSELSHAVICGRHGRRYSSDLLFLGSCGRRRWKIGIPNVHHAFPRSVALLFPDFEIFAAIVDRCAVGSLSVTS